VGSDLPQEWFDENTGGEFEYWYGGTTSPDRHTASWSDPNDRFIGVTTVKKPDGTYETTVTTEIGLFNNPGDPEVVIVTKFTGLSLDNLTMDPAGPMVYEYELTNPDDEWSWQLLDTPTPVVESTIPTTLGLSSLIPERIYTRITSHFPEVVPNIATAGVIAQAERLNIGLTFQSGQWTPTQP
jgi:hypothetical protein